jgi:hypothetical protein
MDVYTEPIYFKGQRAKVVLQCRQQPDFEVCGETVGWERQHPGERISPHFANSEIEWFTKRRNSIIPYRILIKLIEPKCVVKWPNLPRNGSVTKAQIAKCRSKEYFQNGDVVIATKQIRFDTGNSVSKGALGNVVTPDPMAVDWFGEIGKAGTQKDSIRKCEPHEFLATNDVVLATCELDYGAEGKVKKGTLGTINQNKNSTGEYVIKWPEVGLARVNDKQMRKATFSEFWVVGDVAKATRDLHYSHRDRDPQRIIKKDSIGVLTCVDPFTVNWAPHALGTVQVNGDDIVKCKRLQHLSPNDVVKATCDMEFKFDSETKTVKKGDLGTLIEIDFS